MLSKAVALFVLVAATVAAPVLEERAPCSALELVFARGTNQEGLSSVGTPLYNTLAGLVSGATVYNANFPSNVEYDKTVQQGARDVAAHLQAQASACPNQKFALAGYSKGAIVIHETVLTASVQNKIVAIAVFGDPKRLSGDAFPINSQNNVASYCNIGDPICFNGLDINKHFTYGTDGSATGAAQFIAQRFRGA